MRRREFITLAGSAVGTWPRIVGAQQASKIYRIGILLQTQVEREHLTAAFKRGLLELGYVEGQNVDFEIRSAEGNYDRLASLASELAGLRVARC
jgi:putative tryptophan/tyrosine transport system substrate-binding protein